MTEVINYPDSDKNSELSVILSEQKFADMILNFLGKKEKLTYRLKETSFLMRQKDIEQGSICVLRSFDKIGRWKIQSSPLNN